MAGRWIVLGVDVRPPQESILAKPCPDMSTPFWNRGQPAAALPAGSKPNRYLMQFNHNDDIVESAGPGSTCFR